MLGAIVGDIVGSRFEFDNIHTKQFELFGNGCSFTDDTICTCAVADAAMNEKSYRDTLLEWCRRYPNPKGAYGGSFARWIHSADPQPYNSFGNGSAMRVSAVGWLFGTMEEVMEQARLSAEPTHNHPEGIKGAQATASAVFMLRHARSKDDVKRYLENTFGYRLDYTVDYLRCHNSFDETCQVTVPQAIVCFMESNGFEDAIRNAISIGGDSDTIGAITGALAEAFYTVPDDIRTKALTYLDPAMKQILSQFGMITGG